MKEFQRCIPIAAVLVFYLADLGVAASAEKKNIIQLENAKAGTSDWRSRRVPRHDDEWYDEGWNRRKQIEGYCSHTSIRAGETLKVFVNTDPAAISRLIYIAWAIMVVKAVQNVGLWDRLRELRTDPWMAKGI